MSKKGALSFQSCIPRSRGFALVSVLVLGVVTVGLMLSLYEALAQCRKAEASRRYGGELRTAAESGLEYALTRMTNSEPASLTLNGSFIGASAGGVNNTQMLNQMTVTVNSYPLTVGEMQSAKQWSPIYDEAFDTSSAKSIIYAGAGSAGDTTLATGWKVFEAKATLNGASRGVRVVAVPMFETTPSSLSGGGVDSYFKNGIFADSLLQLGGNSKARWGGANQFNNGGNSFQLKLASNGNVSITGASVVRGDVSQTSAKSANFTLDPNSWIYGSLQTNANTALENAVPKPASENFGDGTTFSDAQSGSNVRNVLDGAQGGLSFNSGSDSVTLDPSALTPTTSAVDLNLPTTAVAPTPVGTNNQILPSLSELASSSGLYSSSGNWRTGSLDTSGLPNSGINLNDFLNSSGSDPIRIFIDDSSQSQFAADVSASKLLHPDSPSSLQIYYSGTKDLRFNIEANKTFAATIYAPKAKVSLNGAGTFAGAVLGSTVEANGVKMNLINDFTDNAAGPTGNNGLLYSREAGAPKVTGYKILSWYEFK